GAGGARRASAATISVNGAVVFDRNDVNQQVASLTAPVTLALANTLGVDVQAPTGASVKVTLRGYGVDTVAPALSIDEPLDGVWHALAGTMRIGYSDAISGIELSTESPRITINGVDVTSRFSTTVSGASATFASLYPP